MIVLRYSLALGASLVLAMNTAAQTQVVDMSKFTCDQLLGGAQRCSRSGDLDQRLLQWATQEDLKIDLNVMKHNGTLVVAACKENPKKTVMQTVNTLLGGGKMK